jgi:hypothetical protein
LAPLPPYRCLAASAGIELGAITASIWCGWPCDYGGNPMASRPNPIAPSLFSPAACSVRHRGRRNGRLCRQLYRRAASVLVTVAAVTPTG